MKRGAFFFFVLGACALISAQQEFIYDVLADVEGGNAVLTSTPNRWWHVDKGRAFDLNEKSAYISDGTNPAFIQVEFSQPKTFSKIQALLAEPGYLGRKHNWWVEAADNQADLDNKTGSYEMVVETRYDVDGVWDEAVFGMDKTKKIWRFWAQRMQGDGYVNIVEFRMHTGSVGSVLSLNPPPAMELYEGWEWVYLPSHLKIATTNGPMVIRRDQAQWSVDDPSIGQIDAAGNTLEALSAGVTNVRVECLAMDATMEFTVKTPIREPEYETVDPFLATPAQGCVYEIPVVIMRFIPTDDGITVDDSYLMLQTANADEVTLDDHKQYLLDEDKKNKYALEEGSRFRAFKNSGARPNIGYRVVDIINIYEPTPPSTEFYATSKGYICPRADYFKIFERFNGEDYVNNQGVREFWIWENGTDPANNWYNSQVHTFETFRSGYESNMASPVTGPVSNSKPDEDDLPVYDNTYTVYVENHANSGLMHKNGHQIEIVFGHANLLQDGNKNLFWNDFVGPSGGGRCGWTHNPPNIVTPYGYHHYISVNEPAVLSDIEDWTPDNSGEKTWVDWHAWEDKVYGFPVDYDNDDPGWDEYSWQMYWRQSMPGLDNGIAYGDRFMMTNWWGIYADWDNYMSNNIGLYALYADISVSDSDIHTGESVDIVVQTPVNMTKIPTPLILTDAEGIRHSIPLSGAVPGNEFSVSFCPDETVAFGPARFSFDFNALEDDQGNTGHILSGDIEIAVSENHAPVFTPVPDQVVYEGETVSFTVNATDPDGDELAYSSANLPAGAVFNSQTRTFTWTPGYADAGVYTMTFAAMDGPCISSIIQTEGVTITVLNKNYALPTAEIGWSSRTVMEGTPVSFDGSRSSDVNGSIANYRWIIKKGSAIIRTLNGPKTSYQFRYAGWYDVTLEVTDNDGAVASDNAVVRVNFFESFETSSWSGTGWSQSTWFRWDKRAKHGRYSAHMDGRRSKGSAKSLVSKNFILGNNRRGRVQFSWFIKKTLDSGEYLRCYVSTNGGSNWSLVAALNGARGTGSDEDRWKYVDKTFSNISQIRVKFVAKMNAIFEACDVDAFRMDVY